MCLTLTANPPQRLQYWMMIYCDSIALLALLQSGTLLFCWLAHMRERTGWQVHNQMQKTAETWIQEQVVVDSVHNLMAAPALSR